MAATKGNNWWQLRGKHGRSKIWEDPNALWEDCQEYFLKTQKRKWTKKDWVGKDADEVIRETETPFTINGLCLFLDIGVSTWNDYKNREGYQEFSEVITRVEQIIYTQKFEGATVGAFNANIISRELGLTDKKDLSIEGSVSISFED